MQSTSNEKRKRKRNVPTKSGIFYAYLLTSFPASFQFCRLILVSWYFSSEILGLSHVLFILYSSSECIQFVVSSYLLRLFVSRWNKIVLFFFKIPCLFVKSDYSFSLSFLPSFYIFLYLSITFINTCVYIMFQYLVF